MKKIKYVLASILLTSLVFVSCTNDEVIEPVPYNLKVTLDKNFGNQVMKEVEVTITNTSTNSMYKATTNDAGVANFESVNPGVYNVIASIKFTKATYKAFFGIDATSDEVNFNASLENVLINATVLKDKVLELKTARIGDLVFKQIYYSGSDTKNGAVFRDVFFEIYNNSNEVIYADGLYFGQLYGNSSSTVRSYTLSDGQFDWSKSVGQTKGNASNSDYVYADHIYQIPGTGKENPINPGESIVIAATAINHKQPLTVGTKTYAINDPSLTVDLSNADFEINLISYFNSIGKAPFATDIDNPTVPNLNVAYNLNNKDLIMDPLGRDSFVIFRADDFANFSKLASPKYTKVTSTTRLYVQIPNDVIIDAVETNKADASKLYPRRLSTALDGGYQFTPNGSFSSQAIIRKVAKTFGGRKVLQDTNNSTNDFKVLDKPTPGGW